MIRFVEKGEARASEELIGRFVGKAGVMQSRGYTRPMKVTGISGTRLHGVAAELKSSGPKGPARLAPIEDWTEACFLGVGTVAYVCDTIEECEAVIDASRRALTTWSEGVKRIKADIDNDFDRVVADFADTPVLSR